MNSTRQLTEILRARGFRMTKARLAILSLLHDSPGHFSPVDIYTRIRKTVPGVTETTVYRTLEFLAENDMVLPTLAGDGHRVYEMAGRDHHHLICRSCEQSVEIDHGLVQELYRQLEDRTGYQLTTSHLTFFGLCPDCRAKS